MIKVEILRDTLARVSKGMVIEVTEAEAKRLMSIGNAKVVKETKKRGAAK